MTRPGTGLKARSCTGTKMGCLMLIWRLHGNMGKGCGMHGNGV